MTPPEFCSHMTVDEMADADTTVFVARDDGQAVACGALRRHGDDIGEVKRMYTVPSRQGEGVGGAILERIEMLAREEALARLVLETGHVHDAAYRVYERGGFMRCGPVLHYPDTGYSVFYEKSLQQGSDLECCKRGDGHFPTSREIAGTPCRAFAEVL